MNYKIDLLKMQEIYGEEIVDQISDNMDIISENVLLLKKLKFDDIQGLFERCPAFFMRFPNDFKQKMQELINQIGPDYVHAIQEDISLIEE